MRVFLFIVVLITANDVFAQGEIDEQDRIFYRNEKSVAPMLNSNGIGANFKYSKRVNARIKIDYSLDIVGIKHPKEVKISSADPTYQTTGSYVYGKLNKFYSIRPGIGMQNEMFRKIDRGGISIRNFYGGGLSLGLKKPIYYHVIEYDNVLNEYIGKIEKFNTSPHASNNILRNASYFKGIDEISLVPGVFVKAGFTFEYSKQDEVLHAFETGVIIDVFPERIPIMAHVQNDFFFFTMFISYRFGKVVDARFKANRNRIDDLLLE